MGHIEQNREYFTGIRRTMRELLLTSQDVSHPYLEGRPRHHCTFVVMAGDKGLCGSHNSNVLQYTLTRLNETPGSSLITMGQTAEEFFHSRGMTPDISYLGIVQDPTLEKAREVAAQMTSLYERELSDDLRVIYTSFYYKARGTPVEFRLLPVRLHDYDDVTDAEPLQEIMYHPSAQAVLDLLIPQYVIGLIFGVMVQAYASEHFARMNAMHSATTNAQEMLDRLRTQYNLARQSAITNELTEIAGATEVLLSNK